MITEAQKEVLIIYKEKSYVSSLLAEQSYNYYVWVKNAVNIPLIISNTIMVCINSIIVDQDLLKVLNIILNASTGLILSLISNFHIHENISQFEDIKKKYSKLSNDIDMKLTNDIDNITPEYINNIVEDYGAINESIKYSYPNKIIKKIKKQFEGKLSLPSSISVDVVEVCEEKTCCNKI
jgi:ERCC4-type nuclease